MSPTRHLPDQLVVPAQPGGGVVGDVPAQTGLGGTVGFTPWLSILDASNAAPIVITTRIPHNLVTGQSITVVGARGNTAANGTFTVTVSTSTTFSLDASVGNGVYTGGGFFLLTADVSPPVGRRMTINRGPANGCTVLFQDDDNVQVGPIATLGAGVFLVPGGIPEVDRSQQATQYKITNTGASVDKYDVSFT